MEKLSTASRHAQEKPKAMQHKSFTGTYTATSLSCGLNIRKDEHHKRADIAHPESNSDLCKPILMDPADMAWVEEEQQHYQHGL